MLLEYSGLKIGQTSVCCHTSTCYIPVLLCPCGDLSLLLQQGGLCWSSRHELGPKRIQEINSRKKTQIFQIIKFEIPSLKKSGLWHMNKVTY